MGKITPFGFEQELQEKCAEASKDYESFIKESEDEMKFADDEISQLEKELEMQRIVNEGLNKEKKSNQNKINNLTQ